MAVVGFLNESIEYSCINCCIKLTEHDLPDFSVHFGYDQCNLCSINTSQCSEIIINLLFSLLLAVAFPFFADIVNTEVCTSFCCCCYCCNVSCRLHTDILKTVIPITLQLTQ